MLELFKKLFKKKQNETFGDYQKTLDLINSLEESMKLLSDQELRNKTDEFKARLAAGETLEQILPEAFAVVRETSLRILGLRHYDVQIIGGIILHEGNIAEMATGEGKTLVATLPTYLNALTGKGVHVITVNDYLAERDAKWMGQVYEALGLTVGVVKNESDYDQRKSGYDADITYTTCTELGFDYLRTNMVTEPSHRMQRDLNYVIIDEVDSILIDNARNPLILTGLAVDHSTDYQKYTDLVNQLVAEEHYMVYFEEGTISLKESGVTLLEEMLGLENLYDVANMKEVYRIENALYAKEIMKKDKDYVVHENQLALINPFNGRIMIGHKLKEGIHQAVEAKEGLETSAEAETKGSITYQNFFKMYNKICGMTGTAKTEERELNHVYNLFVYPIPTNKQVIREDYPDVVYKTEEKKNQAIVNEIIEMNKIGRPVLIGTPSVEKSEQLSELLTEKQIAHDVLNAKKHDLESEIIARAGHKGRVTIITNMAGRGTDIKLEQGVSELGGLHVIGTTRNESRRVDNQLRGRAGRQGDKGSSRFYISLDDELMRKFGGTEVKNALTKLNIPEDMPIEHSFVSKMVNQIQIKCEDTNSKVRDLVTKFDSILNEQRLSFYKERNFVLFAEGETMKTKTFEVFDKVANSLVEKYCPLNEIPDEWNLDELLEKVNEMLPEKDPFTKETLLTGIDCLEQCSSEETEAILELVAQNISNFFKSIYNRKEEGLPDSLCGTDGKVCTLAKLAKSIFLDVLDYEWQQHILNVEYAKRGLGLKMAGGKNPMQEFSFEIHEMFMEFTEQLKYDIVQRILAAEIKVKE